MWDVAFSVGSRRYRLGRCAPRGDEYERAPWPRHVVRELACRGGGTGSTAEALALLGLQHRLPALSLGERVELICRAIDSGELILYREVARAPATLRAVRRDALEEPPLEREERSTHWIEIELVDDAGAPVPAVPYLLTLPSGRARRGVLDANGRARVSGIANPGSCEVRFPTLDRALWGAA